MDYPKVGQYIKATFIGRKHQRQVVVGRLEKVARLRTGYVAGFVRTPKQGVKTIPFSTAHTKFEIIG